MKVLIVGSGGMIGRKLISHLDAQPQIANHEISEITGFDVVESIAPEHVPFRSVVGDLSDLSACENLISDRPQIIFHLAAIVSGEAEEDFAKGYRINLDGTRHLLESIARTPGYCPRLVFTSSIAVFGAPFPEAIQDDFHCTPLTSYGTQKAIGELLLNDFSRRGLLDGIGIRLPTICVRPGRPNKAASGFFSNIIREPLAGEGAVLPVGEDVRHWHASPRSAVQFLLHAAELESAALGPRRNLSMPGLSVTVGQQIEALNSIAGESVTARIERIRDPKIEAMVEGWPRRFETDRARRLGFEADESFESIIRQHIDTELDGRIR